MDFLSYIYKYIIYIIIRFSLRLINAMASDFFGRSYLVESESLVKTLINIL